MSCCGQKRAAIARTPSPKAEAPRAAALRRVVLQYLGSPRVTYIGAVTKRLYASGATGANLTVDARDAGGLVALGLFRWVG
jgi:hypothetical protein